MDNLYHIGMKFDETLELARFVFNVIRGLEVQAPCTLDPTANIRYWQECEREYLKQFMNRKNLSDQVVEAYQYLFHRFLKNREIYREIYWVKR